MTSSAAPAARAAALLERVAGAVVAAGLLADLHDLTGEPHWLEGGLGLAQTLAEVYWGDDAPLPRGAGLHGQVAT